MATVHMQYRNDGFATVSNIGGVIEVSAPTWRAKRWAIRQLKMTAATFGITLKKRNGAWYADYQELRKIEYRFFESLKKSWVSPTNSDLGCVTKRTILDKGF